MRTLLTICLLSSFCLSNFALVAQASFQKQLQTQLIMAEDGDTISLPAGEFQFTASLSMDEKSDIVIKGAGMDKTILSFKGQSEGAEGLRITNSKNIRLEHFTIQDAVGDCIKVMETEGISFYEIKAEWTGKPKKTNGSYALYPVQCQNVLIDRCIAIGSSDAGIYVGQSHNIIVRNSTAYNNVAGIEIENSTMADVYNCEAYNNTGGILVFDLPDLPKKKGGNVRVYNNKVYENNYKNFAPGGTVSVIPPGTGILVLATSDVEIYNNDVKQNKTFSISVCSYHITQNKIKDKEYYAYPLRVYIHDNTIANDLKPTTRSQFGLLMRREFKKDQPTIVLDGINDPETLDSNGRLKAENEICIRNNQGGKFAYLDAENNFEGLHTDDSDYNCEGKTQSAPPLGTK
ncbi:MAG: parallel beta-helix domain-containing protein [Bacteroidota bacterium]